jgi:predicted nuclease with TOPRIM domain
MRIEKMAFDIEQVYELINKIKIEITDGLNIHFKYIDEKLDTIIKSADDSENEIIKTKDRVRELEFRMEKIEDAQKQSDCKIIKLQEFFENLKQEIQADMIAIKKLVTPKKLSWPKIISIILSILASPAILLLVQAVMKAQGWL